MCISVVILLIKVNTTWCCLLSSISLHYSYNIISFRISWVIVVILHYDLLSCFSAVRLVIWLAETTFINHHTIWFLITFSEPFCTLHCCKHQNSSCPWSCPQVCTPFHFALVATLTHLKLYPQWYCVCLSHSMSFNLCSISLVHLLLTLWYFILT